MPANQGIVPGVWCGPVPPGAANDLKDLFMKLVHIDASALGAHSVSRGLTAAIVAEFERNHPGLEVTYRDLHAAPLAHWSLPAGENDPQAAEGDKVMEEFLAADVVV